MRGGRRADPRRDRGRAADHRPRRLRRRRRLLDRDPGRARCASSAPSCDWLIPDRLDDGYGLGAGDASSELRRARHRAAGHGRLRDHLGRRGRRARARPGSRSSSPTTTSPASELPDCPIVHPRRRRLPVRGAVRDRRRLQARRRRCARAAGRDPAAPSRDLDLVALATVADLVPLRGREPRARPRAGCAAIAARAAARPARR